MPAPAQEGGGGQGPGGARGAATLELALALPVFLLLVFGLVEFGLVLYVKGMITAASREGARYGVSASPDPERYRGPRDELSAWPWD
jgi:hypothetical protein